MESKHDTPTQPAAEDPREQAIDIEVLKGLVVTGRDVPRVVIDAVDRATDDKPSYKGEIRS